MENDLHRDTQVAATPEGAFDAQIKARLLNLHTCMPGIIASFNSATQTAEVQPAIKRIFAEQGPVNLPLCVDVPVAFPGGGDFFLTFPVKAGDECILMFSERAIDYWYAQGGTAEPSELRLHDLSDGIAIVGLNSQPHKLSALQMDGTELRTRDRGTYIRLTPGTIYIKGDIVHEGDTTQTGNVDLTGNTAQTGSVVLTGGQTLTGALSAAGGVSDSTGTMQDMRTAYNSHTNGSGTTTPTPLM